MTVTAFPLSHGGMESTAFLLESDGDALLCFGDTGPDAVREGHAPARRLGGSGRPGEAEAR